MVHINIMDKYLELKQAVHQHCREVVQKRINTAKADIEDVLEFLHDDNKSSAGDKHETSRAMAHLEVENRQGALQNLTKMNAALKQFDPAKSYNQIVPGALVVTDNGIFYVTISLGKFVVNAEEIMVISYQAPIISALKNIPVGSVATFHDNQYKLLHIV